MLRSALVLLCNGVLCAVILAVVLGKATPSPEQRLLFIASLASLLSGALGVLGWGVRRLAARL